MSTSRTRALTLAAALLALTTAAAAQTSAAKNEPTSGMEPVEPVMDSPILAHVIFSQLEGRWNGTNTEFRWEGQGWVGTDYDKLWIKSEATLSNGALGDSQQQFLYDRAITTYSTFRAGCAAISIHAPPAIGPPLASRVWRPTSSISSSRAMQATKATSPPSSKPPTIFSSHSG